MRNRMMTASVLGVVLGVAAASAAQIPQAVSPGDAEQMALIEARCPTFSWAAVDDATSYEVVVYQVTERGESDEPLLLQTLVGGVTSWTPPLDRCLARGGRYGWAVRADTREGLTEWSATALFQVAAGLSETDLQSVLETARRYLEVEAVRAGLAAEGAEGAISQDEAAAAVPEPEGSISPRAQLIVDGGDISVTSGQGLAYVQLDTRYDTVPLGVHCNQLRETGRMIVQLDPHRLWICTEDPSDPGTYVWDSISF